MGWAVAGLLGVLALQSVSSMRLLSVTSDELTHLPSGYTYLQTGDYRLNPQHPPLVKLLCAAPLLWLDPVADLDDPAFTADPPREWEFGFKFFEANDADRLLFWGRLPVVLLSLLGGWFVYRWARELFGVAAGLTALFLYVFDPNVIAHSHLVTMDVPLACFFLMALYFLWRYAARSGGAAQLAGAGLSLGAALATKYSAAVLLPLMAVLLGLSLLRGPGSPGSDPPRAADGETWPRRLARAAVAYAVLLALAAAVIFIVYRAPDAPLDYWRGLQRVNVDHDPDYPYYLMGEFRKGGFWHYFLAAFAFKTPLITLVLLAASLVWFRRRRAPRLLDEAFLALPAIVFFVVTSALADDLGVRYLLPVYPLLFVWVGRLAAPPPRGTPARLAAAALALWYAGSAAVIYPDHLAYFNEIVGGPRNGHRVLDDSNIDWGQDLKRLKAYLDRHGIESVRLLYGGNASPDYYGIPWEPATERDWAVQPRPGLYAVSTHLLIRGEHYARTRGVKTDWLSRHEPVGRVGYSIYLFRFE